MTEHQGVRFGTRWRVVGVVLAPCLALVVAIGSAMASGALALSFVAQSSTASLATQGLDGDHEGIVVVSLPIRKADGSNGTVPVARIGVATGRINGLCIAHPVRLLGKAFTLLVRGGDTDPSTFEITADGLVIDLADARGVIAKRGNLEVNKSAADVRLGSSPISLGGAADRFGLQADSLQLRNVAATVRAITIPDLLKVPNFSLRVVAGNQACPAP